MKRKIAVLAGALAFGAAACGAPPQDIKTASETPSAPSAAGAPDKAAAAPAPAEEAKQTEEAKKAEEAKKKKEEATQKVAKSIERFRTNAEKERARWTPELQKKAVALIEGKYRKTKDALTAILQSPHRTPGDADRDKFRHPVETLTFFGIEPTMTVVEVGAGGGWYTEILAPLLAKKGKLILAGFDPKGPEDAMRTAYGVRLQLFLEKSPELFGKIETAIVNPPDKVVLGPEGSADMAIAVREMHNWYRSGEMPAYLKAIHAVLKPGGVFGVVQHRAQPDADPSKSAEKGYLPEAWLVSQIEAVGFKLEGKSEVNANPKDTKDYEEGVWTLPPNYRLGDKDHAKYEAIGESDRMTLKFKKR